MAVMNAPEPHELLELMELQNDVVMLLQNDLEVYKEELKTAIELCKAKDEENARLVGFLEEEQQKSSLHSRNVERLEKEKDLLEAELRGLKANPAKETEADLDTVIQLRQKVREMEFDLDREKRANSSKDGELEAEKLVLQETRKELSQALFVHKESESSWRNRLETTNKLLVEAKTKADVISLKYEETTARFEGKLQVAQQKEQHFEQFISELNDEISTTRREKAVLASRIEASIEENVNLRNKIMRSSHKSTQDESNGSPVEKQLRKLLSDQSHLISALREETSMLSSRLEQEVSQSRQTIKALKKENRELEQRLVNVLQI